MTYKDMFRRIPMTEEQREGKTVDETRREFLRKSVYAAYATPVITALLVSQVSAATSSGSNPGQCQKAGGTWYGTGQGCCDFGPNDGCGPDN
jgi:hypothetical protein